MQAHTRGVRVAASHTATCVINSALPVSAVAAFRTRRTVTATPAPAPAHTPISSSTSAAASRSVHAFAYNSLHSTATHSCNVAAVRLFSTTASPSNTSPPPRRTPTLNQLLKRFNLLVHPDLFGSSPAHQSANQHSLSALNELLATLKSRDSKEPYPPKQVIQLVFHIKKRRGDELWAEYVRKVDYHTHITAAAKKLKAGNNGQTLTLNGMTSRNGISLRPPRGGSRKQSKSLSSSVIPGVMPPRGNSVLDDEFHAVPVVMSTNGGQCKNMLGEQLSNMFYRVGLPTKFVWDDEYWQLAGPRQWSESGDDMDFNDDDGYDYDDDDEGEYQRQRR